MPIKKTLNEILEDYQSIELKLLENEGVLDENIEELLNINELELKDKLDGYENFIKYFMRPPFGLSQGVFFCL